MHVQGVRTGPAGLLAKGRLQAASAAIPCVSHFQAAETLAEGLSDPVLGVVSIDHMQLCPQHCGYMSDAVIARLQSAYPDTQFRMHASVRLLNVRQHRILDACNVFEGKDQIEELARMSRDLRAPAYSLHAGPRANGTLEQAFDNIRKLVDLFECPVAIEGLYPFGSSGSRWLLGSWDEYAQLLTANVDYAIDLSHIGIVSKWTRRQEPSLIDELLASPRCIEVHLSDNNGRADSHKPLTVGNHPWWLPHLNSINDNAVVFYEGVLREPARTRTRTA